VMICFSFCGPARSGPVCVFTTRACDSIAQCSRRATRARESIGRRGAARPVLRAGAKREARSATVRGLEVLTVDADVVAEPGDTAADHAVGEIRKWPARAIDQLEPPGRPGAHLEAGKLGVGVELLHLAEDVGLDPTQELERGAYAVDEDGVERGEGPEEVHAEAS